MGVRARRIHAIAPTTSADVAAVVAWDPITMKLRGAPALPLAERGFQQELRTPLTCLAGVSLAAGKLQAGPVVAVEAGLCLHFDKVSKSVITVGFSMSQMIIVQQFDSDTLRLKCEYRLPLSVAWMLRAP